MIYMTWEGFMIDYQGFLRDFEGEGIYHIHGKNDAYNKNKKRTEAGERTWFNYH